MQNLVMKYCLYTMNLRNVMEPLRSIENLMTEIYPDFNADTVFKKLVTNITYIHVVNEG